MKSYRITSWSLLVLTVFCIAACNPPQNETRETIDLSGEWEYSNDSDQAGMDKDWPKTTFTQRISLPYSNVDKKDGNESKSSLLIQGIAWFSKRVSIPNSWEGKAIRLILERTKYTLVWVDGQYAGQSDLTFSPQYYDLTRLLSPGDHTLTLRVDNGQSRTNGYPSKPATIMLGEMKLEASTMTHLKSMYIIPEPEARKIHVKLRLANAPKKGTLRVQLGMDYLIGDLNVKAAAESYRVRADSIITLHYTIKGKMPAWDDYKHPLLRMTARVSDEQATWTDALSNVFGFRTFGTRGTRYVVNNRVAFLRGFNESGQSFRSSGVPMDADSWLNYFHQAKNRGFNFCRFVSWCPPEAAFKAADKVGIFIQLDLNSTNQNIASASNRLYDEENAILSTYGNHPSFVLFSASTPELIQRSPYARSLSLPIGNLAIRQYPVYEPKTTSNIAGKAKDLLQASSKLATLCYRADIEAALRTPGLPGYTLSGYPSLIPTDKRTNDLVDPEQWLAYNNDVVPLLVFDSHCLAQSTTFGAVVEVANYSNKPLTSTVKWILKLENGKKVKSGVVSRSLLKNGSVSNLGQIHFSLADFNTPVKLNLTVFLDSTDYRNTYPLWVYPNSLPAASKKIMVSSLLNKAVTNQLEAGGNVLLLPTIRSIYSNSLPGSFFPEFQGEAATSAGTLGLLIDSDHPLFKDFPTESHSNWQWMNSVNSSRALNLSLLDSTYTPIVGFIDNPKRNNKLGMICEFKVGAGRLIICTSKLFEIMDKPEVVQLYNSLLRYMESPSFKPTYQLAPETLKRLVSYTVTPIQKNQKSHDWTVIPVREKP